MRNNSRLGDSIDRFAASWKGFVAMCLILTCWFYFIVYIVRENYMVEDMAIYNDLRDVAYDMAEERRIDYPLSETLLSYKISLNEDGTKSIILRGQDAVAFQFTLSQDYEINVIENSWSEFEETTSLPLRILKSLCVGIGGTVLCYGFFILLAWYLTKKIWTNT